MGKHLKMHPKLQVSYYRPLNKIATKASPIITGNGHSLGWDTIHNVILFVDISTVLDTTNLILIGNLYLTIIASTVFIWIQAVKKEETGINASISWTEC